MAVKEEKKQYKVLRFIARLNVGGPAIHTVLLSKGMNDADFSTTLVCGKPTSDEGDMSYYAQENGVSYEIIDAFDRKISVWGDVKTFFRLIKIIRREKPDVIHTHTAKAGAVGRVAGILTGVPVKVHTFHGHVFRGYFGAFKTNVFLFIERVLGLFTDKVLTVSDSLAKEISDEFRIVPRSKINVIPLGFELGRFLDIDAKRGDIHKEFGLSSDTALVAIVGRLVPIKDHKTFFDSAKLILAQDKNRKIKFLVVGDGQLRKELEDYVRSLGIEEDVIFTGWMKDMERLYADVDVVVCSSLNEGTPVSIIEAMASKRAVVATDVGGIKDLITDGVTGLIVEHSAPQRLAEAVLRFMRDDSLRSIAGINARTYVSSRYSSSRLVGDMRDLYKGLLRKKL